MELVFSWKEAAAMWDELSTKMDRKQAPRIMEVFDAIFKKLFADSEDLNGTNLTPLHSSYIFEK